MEAYRSWLKESEKRLEVLGSCRKEPDHRRRKEQDHRHKEQDHRHRHMEPDQRKEPDYRRK